MGSGLLERVDPDTASLQTEGDTLGGFLVLAPDASTKTGVAVVGRVVDDGRLEPVAILLLDISTAGNEVVALVLAVLEESLDLLVLHLVLDGTEHGALLIRRADFETGSDLGHCIDHGSVDLLVDVDTLGGNANLAKKLASEEFISNESPT